MSTFKITFVEIHMIGCSQGIAIFTDIGKRGEGSHEKGGTYEAHIFVSVCHGN